MQRFDREWHLASARMRQDGGETFGNGLASIDDVSGVFREPPDNEDETLRAERRRLVDGALVVVNCAGSGEHATAAIAGDGEAIVLDRLHRF